MLDLTMTIAGKPEVCKETFPVLNPANGQVLGYAPECTADLLGAAVASAHEACEAWRADPAGAIIGVARHCCEAREQPR